MSVDMPQNTIFMLHLGKRESESSYETEGEEDFTAVVGSLDELN